MGNDELAVQVEAGAGIGRESPAPSAGRVVDALVEWVGERRGVEVFVEPKTPR